MRCVARTPSSRTGRRKSPARRWIRRQTPPCRPWGNRHMTQQTAQAADPFDLDFDGDSEFATPITSGAPDAADPFAGISSPHPVEEEDGDIQPAQGVNP